MTESRTERDAIGIATGVVLAIGVALRFVAYIERSTLWTDEAALARNILERSLRDLLLVPLDYGQASPKGFLVLEWLVTRTFGTSDLAFRFVPFASGIASLVLFGRRPGSYKPGGPPEWEKMPRVSCRVQPRIDPHS